MRLVAKWCESTEGTSAFITAWNKIPGTETLFNLIQSSMTSFQLVFHLKIVLCTI